jgi:hypothetical protein
MQGVLLLACQLVLAAVLLAAATGKILRTDEFLAALTSSRIPRPLVRPVAFLVPALEICLSAALLLSTPRYLPVVMSTTAGLIAAFTAWMFWVYAQGLRLRCGCFGAGSSDVGPRTIVRNLSLLGLSLTGLILIGSNVSLLLPPSVWMAITIPSIGLCLVLLAAARQARHALVLTVAELQHSQADTEVG